MLFQLIFKKIILFLGDIVLFFISLIITLLLKYGNNFSWDFLKNHIVSFSMIAPFWILAMIAIGGYDLETFKEKESLSLKIFFFWFFSIISSIVVFYLFPHKDITPKTNLLLFSIVFCALAIIWRKITRTIFLSYFLHEIAILINSQETKEFSKEIARNTNLGYKICEFYNHKDLFLNIFEKQNIDTIILSSRAKLKSSDLEKIYQSLPPSANIINVINAYEKIFKKIPIKHINNEWLLNNLEKTKKSIYEKVKRILDIIFSLIIATIFLPILLLVPIIILIFHGRPIFYKQERVGLNNKEFILYKFRTMIKNAEENGPQWAQKKDERITFIGNFLRKFHLDEIPQIFNILRGDMSLVGPRPERPEFVSVLSQKIPYYRLRHIIKPGLTGWAQIKFRYSRSIKDSWEKFQHDLYYIKNRSLILDLQILLKTVQLFFKKE